MNTQASRRDHKRIDDSDFSDPDEIDASETESDVIVGEISSDDDIQAMSMHTSFTN